jgi:hypothetical protein
MLAAVLASAVAGCSKSEPEDTPVACLGGPDAYLEALQSGFPANVRLADGTRISDCLPPEQEGGDLAEVGSTMVTAATLLNEDARGVTPADAALRLGYLVGAAERGAEDTAGIHRDLLLRLQAAATFSPAGELSKDFKQQFEQGREAGRSGG